MVLEEFRWFGGICGRKILFRIKKEAEQTGFKGTRTGHNCRRPQKISGPPKGRQQTSTPPSPLHRFCQLSSPARYAAAAAAAAPAPAPAPLLPSSVSASQSPAFLSPSFLLLLRDPNGSLFPPRCPHPDPQVLLPCRGGDLPTPRRCRHYLLVAIRWPERLSARVQVTLFAWGSRAVVS